MKFLFGCDIFSALNVEYTTTQKELHSSLWIIWFEVYSLGRGGSGVELLPGLQDVGVCRHEGEMSALEVLGHLGLLVYGLGVQR